MRQEKKRQLELWKGVTASLLTLSLVLLGAQGAQAESEAEAATVTDATVPFVGSQGYQPSRGATEPVRNATGRKERLENFLANHPRLKEKMDANGDGEIDKVEFKKALRKLQYLRHMRKQKDCDNNPPGAAGGPGTNWENVPGPQGGYGTSPDYESRRNFRRDWDNNPPGSAGGPGTNWENRPGRIDGPGSGPDHCRVEHSGNYTEHARFAHRRARSNSRSTR